MESVSADDARRVALHSVGLLSSEPTAAVAQRSGLARQAGIVRSMLDSLGAVQLDTISVLARTHELVAYSRFGAIRRDAIERAYWSDEHAFEYWSHAACLLPMSSWPLFAFRRRHYRRKGERWHGVPKKDLKAVLALIRDSGPITTSDVGGAKSGSQWWEWSDAKIALEMLLDVGDVVVTSRVGWRRTYDLAERVVPAEYFHDDLTDDECASALIAAGARLMGIGTPGDIADVHRLPVASVAQHADDAGLIPVRVPGWSKAWATRAALDWLADSGRDRHRTTLISPFDPLVWFRDRLHRNFGMHHRIEAYTPAHKRVHGYFAMPVLHQGRLVARVDPKREGSTLVARRVTFEDAACDRRGRVRPSAFDGVAGALHEAARWVGATSIACEGVVPSAASAELGRRLAATG